VNAFWRAIAATIERLATANPAYVAAVFALYVVSLFIVGARWRRFLRALGGDVGVARATLATLGGIAVGNLTPSSRLAGEACRIALARQGGSATWTQVTIASIWDRLSEVPPILVLAAMSLVAIRQEASTWRAGSVVVGVALALAGASLAVRALRRSGVTLAGWRERLALDRISGRVYAAGVGYSMLLWLQDFGRLACAGLAFGVRLSPTRVATLSMLAMLGGLIPTVGGVGAVEGGLVAGLVAFGIDAPTAAAITAVERAISYGFSTAAGALVVALFGGRSLWASIRSRTVGESARAPAVDPLS
jgi:hypothetical protein